MGHSIATVIHYCSNEYRFLKKNIEEAKKFSRLIIIPIADHFFNGEKENRAILNRTYRDFPDCRFIEFVYYPDRLYSRFISGYSTQDREWGFFWHSTSRYIAALFLPEDIEYVLFLDADEIIDGNRFLKWLNANEYRSYTALRLRCYVYVHQAHIRAEQLFSSGLLARVTSLDGDRMINSDDRHGIFNAMPDPKKNNLLDDQGIPFIHHYPWVRTKEECLVKSQTWGHRHDKDWNQAIQEMFEQPNDSHRMDLNVTFEEAPIFFDPLLESILIDEREQSIFSHVVKVDEKMVFQKQIEAITKL